ncbi:MAG TPA: NAD(P)-dependent oxidoreductase [Steroidobacteraceae bacterium]|nr:NAD(P)-dependent oxidoreductase [Steroidobacteraceae bacterium]
MTTAPRVGFVGLGAMGRGMARCLHRRGLLECVWNRSRPASDQIAGELQVPVPGSPAELAEACDVVVLCVSADADMLDVVDQLAGTLKPGAIVVDCSTVSADTAREAARRLGLRDVDFLDAPVSGGVEGARQGTLAIMVGGPEAAFERARPVLEAMGGTVTRFGETGAGQAAKATNQIMCAGIIQAVAEAMAFAKAEGLPLEALIDTLGKGAGSSWYFVNRAPNIVRGSYPPGFRVRLHEKDLKICREMAARHGVELPLVEAALEQYRQLIEQGHGDEDISTLFRLKDALFEAGERVSREPPGE